MSGQQQFHGAVDQVAAGDIKNFFEAPKVVKDPLVKAQRKRLNILVAQIAEDCKVPGPTLWLEVLHPQLGVESINEITRDQFQVAVDALEGFRREHRERIARHELAEQVKQLAQTKGLHFELARFCTREFGIQELESLGRTELQQALSFVDDRAAPKPSAQAPSGTPTAPAVGKIPLRQLVASHPLQAGVLVAVGFIVGKLF